MAEYDAIIQLARAGEHAQAADALKNWSAPQPPPRQINSDLTVILQRAGRDTDALALAKKMGLSGLEPYAIKSAAVAARNLQDAPWAVTAYRALIQTNPADCDARLGLALSLVDVHESAQAGAALDELESGCTPAPENFLRSVAQARTYWAARRTDVRNPQELLALAWWTERLDGPDQPDSAASAAGVASDYRAETLREAILLASRSGAHHLVNRWMQRGPVNVSSNEAAQVLSAKAAQQIRWAIASPDDARAEWRSLLNGALESLNQAKALATDKPLRTAIASDTIAAYSEVGDDANTLKEVNAADSASLPLLPYAEVAAADALMRANRPAAAEIRLRSVLARLQASNEFDQRDVSISLFYALADQGKFTEARRWIEGRALLVPAFANRGLAGVEVEDDGYVRFQLARSSLLSPSLDGPAFKGSRAWVSNLLRDAPFNTDVRLNDAAWLQARGWPRAAADATQLVIADKPDNTRALDIAARQALDKGDFVGFAAYQKEMQRLDAHPQMQTQLRTVADRQTGFVLAGEAVRGSGTALDPSSGSSDREAALSLLSPVFQNRWRLKARWRESNAQFGAAAPSTQFFAVGARLYWPYFWADVEAVRRASGDSPPGLRLSSQWQIADGVSVFASLASKSEELPLRGQAAGQSATSAQLSVDWRAIAQTYVGVNFNAFNATDGNRQRSAGMYVDQAYTLSDHWRANARFDLSRTTNSSNNVAYFSPQALSAYAVTGTVTQDLVTAGQTGWSHKLALSVGEISQRGFDRGASHSVSYEHEWRLGSYRTLSAAIGELRRPYDGVQSRRKTFSLRWSIAI